VVAERTVADLTKIAEGREAELFAWEDGKVLRLFHTGRPEAEAERQGRMMEEVGDSGVRAPKLYGRLTIEGRHGLVMERLDGPDLLTALGSAPWRLFSIAATCGRVQASFNAAPAPVGLPQTADRLASYVLDPQWVPPQFAEVGIERLRRLPRGDRLLHGDFHPGNVMMKGREPVVIDWTNATSGPPEADFARTIILLSIGEPPPGTPFLVRALASTAGKLFGALYAREYRKRANVDNGLVEAWKLPIAVARLSEGIEQEREKLFRLIAKLSPA
jgi:aminoglycoside phosphotransferase (APT) family kinase protein